MKGYVGNIEQATLENDLFRKVLYTGQSSQLVVMALPPGEEIGEEVHQLDQFIRCEAGEGKAILDGLEHGVTNGTALLVPAGARHNIVNTSAEQPLKLYTVYAPPNHRDGVVHNTRADALKDDEYFDGRVSEPQ